jgi:hypothetical protein
MFRYKVSGLLLLWLLMLPLAWGDAEVVGYVKTTTPAAFLIIDTHIEPAQVGSPVYAGCVIKTDARGTLGITLKDNTVLSFGPDTEFKLTEFMYQPASEQLKLDMNLLQGTLHYISGVIAKLRPNAVKLNTPTGIIAVRGTHFVVRVEN